MEIGAIQRATRADKLYMRVVDNLAKQIIRAGSEHIITFPAEPELCKLLGVSRTVLREAIKVLEAKGLVEVGHGQGMVSRGPADWNHLDPDVLKWQCEAGADKIFIRNLSEIREIIEPTAAALAAERADEAALARLNAAYDRMVECRYDPQASIQADLDFHNQIVAACGNHILCKMAQSIDHALRMSLEIYVQVPERLTHSYLPLHRVLLDAICRRDAAGASAAVLVIIRQATKDVGTVLQEHKGESKDPE